jgi:anti-anti-sigma factor
MAELLQIITLVHEDGVTVRLVGELDLSTAGPVDAELERRREPGRSILIDLSELTFIDSVGIGLLVRWHAQLAASGGRLRLRGIAGQVRQVFLITAMLEHFTLEDDDLAPG